MHFTNIEQTEIWQWETTEIITQMTSSSISGDN